MASTTAPALNKLEVEMRPIESVRPYTGNPRVCPSEAVEAVARSIEAFGFRQAIVVDEDGVIIVGHTRLAAAKKLGLREVPVHVASLTPEQARAYRIADNRTGQISGWDDHLLAEEIRKLGDAKFDISLLAFEDAELQRLVAMDAAPEPQCDPDETPEPPAKPVTQPGDLWILGGEGGHRLLCGDSTSAADVDRLMDGEKAGLCATDPPYLVDYTGERPDHDGGNEGGKDWSATYREVDIKDADGFFRGVFSNVKRVLGPNAAIYCWHAHKRCGVIQRVWEELGILDHQAIVWVKPTPVFGRVFWHFRHEPCMMGWVQGSRPEHDGDHSMQMNSVWEIDWEGKARIVGNEHPTQKPVEIFARPIRKHTRAGDICYEPFSGSGSQIIAAEQLGRRCFAMEITPTFVDVAVRRWETFTGKKAERIPAG